MSFIFWFSFFLIFYTYIGYGIVLYLLVALKGKQKSATQLADNKRNDWPPVTYLVAAYNEADWIEKKILNSLDFDYPTEQLTFYFVTDGSDDKTPQIIQQYIDQGIPNLYLFHRPEREGKIAAVKRVMPQVNTPIIIFSDANTFVNKEAIKRIVAHYEDPTVGAVAGEKRIRMQDKAEASSAGEGFYWKYESKLKQLDAALYSVVGAAGELFSIRTTVYEPVPSDTIIEDFYMTLRIAQKGYRVAYEPNAYAVEGASANVKEELKRKIRIAAGGIQAIIRLAPLLNIFNYGMLSFQYISHRVLRWTLTPIALLTIFISNAFLVNTGHPFYMFVLVLQILFYLAALLGYFLERQKIKFKVFFIPYYFCIMNYAVYRGFFRILRGRQSVLWERAQRGD